MTYKEHQAMQAARGNYSNNSEDRPKVHFVSEFLSEDNSVIVVRFPYHSMDDIVYTPTHNVEWPGVKYGKRVACNEQGPCDLCNAGIKADIRVFVKFITYTAEPGGNVVRNNTLWDRPSAFADIDLKGLFDEYGDISTLLFKIRRSGTGKATRYNIQPVINTAVYPADVYVADFSELDQIDPVFIMTKSQAQYNAMLHPETVATSQPASAPAATAPATGNYVSPTPTASTAPWETPSTSPAPQDPNAYVSANVSQATPPQAPASEQPRRQVRYTF